MPSTVSHRPIHKVLIANRGEIALRIMRTVRAMGLQSVAVYSDVDADMPFARYADEAVHIGPATAAESYLIPERIIEAAHKTGADAIHPGYGFLSENAAFAQATEDAGIAFIGPRPSSIQTMGDKLSAKAAVACKNVPVGARLRRRITDLDEAERWPQKSDFPSWSRPALAGAEKACAWCTTPPSSAAKTQRAMSEATSAFGNGAVFLERFVTEPRHIEIQVLCDAHGNGVHLLSGNAAFNAAIKRSSKKPPVPCSMAPFVSKWAKCAWIAPPHAVTSVRGPLSFWWMPTGTFYFLEMNTRLQVEHPVTEMITGVDLVEEQIRIARGEVLRLPKKCCSIQGHAIELRVYAEDVPAGFLPSTGKLAAHIAPEGPGIRVDAGVETGDDISIYYDPMISKLCAHGMDRNQAIERLRRAIDEYTIQGVETTLDFGRFVLDHPAFVSGKFDTGFVSTHFDAARFTAYNEARKAPLNWSAATAVLETADHTADSQHPGTTSEPSTGKAWRGRFAE